tara:strand:+ start:1634 stop:3484 length:1851 start_codon:yes stop_codon:yes gene_type:complete
MTQQDWRAKSALLQHRISKFNPNHDATGRFTTAEDNTTGTGGGRKIGGMSAAHAEIVSALNRSDKSGMTEAGKPDPRGVFVPDTRAYKFMARNVSILTGHKITAKQVREVAESQGRTRQQQSAARMDLSSGRRSKQKARGTQLELPFPKPRKESTAAETRRATRRAKREGRRVRRSDPNEATRQLWLRRRKAQRKREGLEKFNPYHDEQGRFTTGPGGTGVPVHIQNEGEGTHREFYLIDGKWWGDGQDLGGDDLKKSRREQRELVGVHRPKDSEIVAHSTLLRDLDAAQHKWERADTMLDIEASHPDSYGPDHWSPETRLKHLRKRRQAAEDAWDLAELRAAGIKRPEEVQKFNPYHDEIGRFTESGGNSTGAPGGYPGGRPVKGGKPAAGGKPIKTGDVKEALRLLAEGKHVELESVEQVSTLVKGLNKIVQDAEKKGDKAPSYDLCKVSVANTNIFCAEHKDIPRLKMPQLKGQAVKGSKAAGMKKDKGGEVDVAGAFIQKMKDDGVKVTKENVKSNTLRASQSELVGSKVAGMVASARAGNFDPEAGTIYVSKDGYIIDGHHRWAATIGLDAGSGRLGDRTINVVRVAMPILEVLKEANDFTRDIGIKPKKG